MHETTWRVEALSLPALSLPCARCARTASFHCAERFRVNASGARLDVWLLYRCGACGETHKERVHRRTRADALPAHELAAFAGGAPAAVRRWAFALARGAEVPVRVVRAPLAAAPLRVRIAQPEPCGVRWDRLLARELGVSRAQLARAAAAGCVRVNGGAELRRVVRDGDTLALDASFP